MFTRSPFAHAHGYFPSAAHPFHLASSDERERIDAVVGETSMATWGPFAHAHGYFPSAAQRFICAMLASIVASAFFRYSAMSLSYIAPLSGAGSLVSISF